MDHVSTIAAMLHSLLDAYDSEHEDCDVNDIMSAVALVLVQMCQGFKVTRTEMLRNMSATFEAYEDQQMH